ncbi:MAG: 2Fe-2S iron-sulfur cluster-binding protein [Eubacterium ramulus]
MKITIEINGKTETFAGNWENRTLLEAFQELGITQVHAPCGGIGTCKKCLVKRKWRKRAVLSDDV